MAEGLRWPRQLIGAPGGLQFELDLEPADEHGLAQGQGRVFLEGEPIWFTEDAEGQELPLAWTWVDLLAFLGRWPSLGRIVRPSCSGLQKHRRGRLQS